MARFIYRYQTLLEHRRTEEDRHQRELAGRVRTRMILTDQLRSMQKTISQSKCDLGDALTGTVDLSRVGEFTRYNAESTHRGRQMVRRLAELEGQVESARRQLIDATHQRKALELLRDRDLAEWKKHQARRETAELDELASVAVARGLIERRRRAQQEAAERAVA